MDDLIDTRLAAIGRVLFLGPVLVLIAWVFFRAENMGAALSYLGAMFGLGETGPGAPLLAGVMFGFNGLFIMGVCLVVSQIKTQSWDFVQHLSWVKLVVLLGLFFISLAAMFAQAFNPFLYFQF